VSGEGRDRLQGCRHIALEKSAASLQTKKGKKDGLAVGGVQDSGKSGIKNKENLTEGKGITHFKFRKTNLPHEKKAPGEPLHGRDSEREGLVLKQKKRRVGVGIIIMWWWIDRGLLRRSG